MTEKVQNIIVIESLGKADGNTFTGEALYNDYIRYRIAIYEKEIFHKLHKVENTQQLITVLESYITNSPYMPSGIVLHFEMHGDKELKGLILSDGNLIEWEKLVDLFRKINIIKNDNLFITMGTCNGRYLFKGVDPYKKSPYSGYISASIEVAPEEIYIKFGKLFEELIISGNIVDSYLEMEKTESNFFYKDSERTFDEAFENTMKELSRDLELRRQILSESITQVKDETGAEITKEEADEIMKIALKDIYIKQKLAFDFSDGK